MPEIPEDVMYEILWHLQVLVEDTRDDIESEEPPTTLRAEGRSLCLVSRAFLPFGRQLLYRSIRTESASRKYLYDAWEQRPGPLVKRLTTRPKLGRLVQEWDNEERDYPGSPDSVLDMHKIDKACPNLRKLSLILEHVHEGKGEAKSSHLSRQIRALAKSTCTLASRLVELTIGVEEQDDSTAHPLKVLTKLLPRLTSLTTLNLYGVELVGLPSSFTFGPPLLRILEIETPEPASFLPLIEACPLLDILNIHFATRHSYIGRCVTELRRVQTSVRELTYQSGVSVAQEHYLPHVDVFIGSFAKLSRLKVDMSGRRSIIGEGLDLTYISPAIEVLVLEEQSSPPYSRYREWLLTGKQPLLGILDVGKRGEATEEGPKRELESLLSICISRGIVLKRDGVTLSWSNIGQLDRGYSDEGERDGP